MKGYDDIPDFPLHLLVNRDVDSTCCFPPRTFKFYNCYYLDCYRNKRSTVFVLTEELALLEQPLLVLPSLYQQIA